MGDGEMVLFEAADGVAVVTINNPARRNALGGDLTLQLADTLGRIAAEEAIRVVILTGAGKDFCVGADIQAVAGGLPATDAHYQRLGKVYAVPRLLHQMPQVTIAAVDGGCAGAGLGFACACDFRFATARAMFSTAFLRVGVASDMGTPWSLTRLVGPARARELSFFPDKFGGEDALRLGLASRLFEPGELLAGARAAAAELAARSPLALRTLKANFLAAEALAFNEYMDLEAARHSILLTGGQAREAFKAAAEKREPNFG